MTTFKNPLRLGARTSRAYQKMLMAGYSPEENVKTPSGVFVTWYNGKFSAVVLFSRNREVKAYTFFDSSKILTRRFKK